MDYQNEKHSCENCIWRDQCAEEMPCDNFDDGMGGAELPSETEIEVKVEVNRSQYREGFEKYTDANYTEKLDFFSVRSLDDLKKLEKGCD